MSDAECEFVPHSDFVDCGLNVIVFTNTTNTELRMVELQLLQVNLDLLQII